jgi:hypothetical protein
MVILALEHASDREISSLIDLHGSIPPEIPEDWSVWMFPFLSLGVGTEYAEQWGNSFCDALMPIGLRTMVHHLKDADSLHPTFINIFDEPL